MSHPRGCDLAAELHALPSAFDPQYYQLPDLALFLPGLGATSIEIDGQFWQPAECGPLAVIVPAYYGQPPGFLAATEDEPEQPHDLIAFYPDRPDRWWWRTGLADMLGGHLIGSAMTSGTRLFVVSGPLGYLRTCGQAACILHDDAIDRLIGVKEIVANLDVADHIDCRLRRPPAPMPRFLVLGRATA